MNLDQIKGYYNVADFFRFFVLENYNNGILILQQHILDHLYKANKIFQH